MLTAEQVIRLLRLALHPEGGCYRETYRAGKTVAGGARSASTAIYYLLAAADISAIHRLGSDEVFHFYAEDPVEMFRLSPDGGGRVVVLCSSAMEDIETQVVVPKGF
jgi:uncharacterized protein